MPFAESAVPSVVRPGHETLEIGGERADAGGDAVRDHQKGVGMKQRRNLQLVGLKLVEGGRKRCLAAARRFQFDHDEGQAVDKENHVRPPVVPAADDRELSDRQPVIALRPLEIDERYLASRQHSIVAVVLHIHAFGQQHVDAAVFLQQIRQSGLSKSADGIASSLARQMRIEPGDSVFQAFSENDLAVALPFRDAPVRADVCLAFDLVAELAQLVQQNLFNIGFGQEGHLRFSFKNNPKNRYANL